VPGQHGCGVGGKVTLWSSIDAEQGQQAGVTMQRQTWHREPASDATAWR